MTWKTGFYAAVRDFLVARGIDATDVTGVAQENPSMWYCSTCGPDPIEVHIYYTDSDGLGQTYTYWGDMGEFIEALT